MKRQRGFSEYIVLLILAGVLTAVGLAALAVYNHSIERAKVAEIRAEKAEQSASDQRAINAQLTATAAATEVIRSSRQGYNVKQADVERMVASAIQNAYAQSPEARQWAATSVPATVNAGVLADGSQAGRNQVIPGTTASGGNGPNPGPGLAPTTDKRPTSGPRNPLQKPPSKL